MADYSQIALRWLGSGDTGMSSKALCFHMLGLPCRDPDAYPSDPQDLGRCLRLLDLIPEWKPRVHEMATHGPGWAGLSAKWSELDAMMREECGVNWEKGGAAPRTYKAMKLAQADGYRNDPNYDCRFREDGTISSWSHKMSGASAVKIGAGTIIFGGVA